MLALEATSVANPRIWALLPVAEAVEKFLKNPFSAEIGEHCQSAEFLSY